MTPDENFQSYLSAVNACRDARKWAGGRTAEQAWSECDRGDWLLWWAAKAGIDKKVIVRIVCEFVRAALQFVKPGEERPLRAIETAERWCEGKATTEEVRRAASAAFAAAHDAAAYAAAYAAFASAHAASAASAAFASAHAAYAAYAASAAFASAAFASTAIWEETRAAKLREFALVVRQKISFAEVQKGMNYDDAR